MIEVQGITKSFEGLQVLKGVDLRVDAGEIVSIVRPSGLSKTTLLQIMGTLDRPDSGRVSFDGEDPLSMNASRLARFRNRNVGFVFQFHQLLPEFTLLENVAMHKLCRRSQALRCFRSGSASGGLSRLVAAHGSSSFGIVGGERQRAAVPRSGQRSHGCARRRAVGES